jgi:hypothetical protein
MGVIQKGGNLEKQIVNLIELIHKEVSSLENFLKLLAEEERCLINNRFDLLEESIRKQEQAITQAKQLEEIRKEITSWLSKDLKIEHEQPTLSKLIQLLDSSYSSKLNELQKTLLDLHRKVETQRKRNEELIKKSIGCRDHDIKFLIDVSPTSCLKDSIDDQGKAKPSLILDEVG